MVDVCSMGTDILQSFSFFFQRPTQVQLDITNKCNLNCIYCYNSSNSFYYGREMDDCTFKGVVSQIISDLRPVFVSFSGGEPLLRKELLLESISMLKKGRIEVHINTNALLFDNKLCEFFKKLNVDKININVESLDANKYDKMRGKKGSYRILRKKLELLKSSIGAQKLSIAVVVTKENLHDLLSLATFVKKNNFMELHLLDMIPTFGNDRTILLTKKEWVEFYKIFNRIKSLGIRIKPNHALLFLSSFREKVFFPFCMAGRLKMVICSNGKVVPCNYFKDPKYVCGDATKEKLLKIWKDSEVMNRFRYSMKGYESCNSCEFIKGCAGGCKALALGLRGKAFSPDPYCFLD